jgi:hypothetical protein
MSEDGWNKVGMTSRTSRYTVDTTKLKVPKDDSAIILGNVGQFRGWSGGANAKSKDASKRPAVSGGDSTYSPNMYAALDNSNEDGKRPLPLSRYNPVVDALIWPNLQHDYDLFIYFPFLNPFNFCVIQSTICERPKINKYIRPSWFVVKYKGIVLGRGYSVLSTLNPGKFAVN